MAEYVWINIWTLRGPGRRLAEHAQVPVTLRCVQVWPAPLSAPSTEKCPLPLAVHLSGSELERKLLPETHARTEHTRTRAAATYRARALPAGRGEGSAGLKGTLRSKRNRFFLQYYFK